jgi:hypothetical protein
VAVCGHMGRKTVIGAFNLPHYGSGWASAQPNKQQEVNQPTLPSAIRGPQERISHSLFRPYGRKSTLIEQQIGQWQQEFRSTVSIRPYPAGRTPNLSISQSTFPDRSTKRHVIDFGLKNFKEEGRLLLSCQGGMCFRPPRKQATLRRQKEFREYFATEAARKISE